jgi:polysaccharide biosynthesis/export protein
MKWFNPQVLFISVFVFIMGLVGFETVAVSAPLAYQGRQDQMVVDPNAATQAQMGAVPVGYDTTGYGPQFPAYASYMQSPYSNGPMQQQYMPGGGPAGPGMQGAGGPGNIDPYGALEVSPYSHYSPYIEVVGEGSTYSLGVDDVVTIVVRNQPDFSGRFVVDPEGHIQYPFVGDIKATGLTKTELKMEIEDRLKRYVRYPEIAVMISEYRSKSIYVLGQVGRPGKYAMKGDKITVKEAIVAAGLPRGDAALSRVYVIRPSEFNEDGKPHKKKVDLKKLLKKGISDENFMLEPGDMILVNQRYFDKFTNNFARLVGPAFQAAAVYDLGTRFTE